MLQNNKIAERSMARKLVKDLLGSYWDCDIIEKPNSSRSCWPVFVYKVWFFSIFIKGLDFPSFSLSELRGDDALDVAKLIYKVFKAGGWLKAEIAASSEDVVENVVVKPEDAAAAEFMVRFDILDFASEA